MAYEKKIAEISSQNWSGLTYRDQQTALISLYTNIGKLADNYLDQNERTVLKALRKDNFESDFKKELLEIEKEGKNRKKIIEALQ